MRRMAGRRDVGMGDMTDTKLEIFNVAVDLFFERGYANVGMRDIANAVGIKSASIYNHFESKEALLERIYQFFHDNYREHLPNVEEIVDLIPQIPPHEAFEKLQMPLNSGGVYETLKKVIMIAEYECNMDARARAIIVDMFDSYTRRIATALEKMIEKEVIEPVNVDLFASILVRFGMSTASRVESLRNLSVAEWRAVHKLLFGLVRVRAVVV